MTLMIDGVKSQVDAYNSILQTDLPLQLIERIEILKGNASAMYGNAAVGGVINIITRRGKREPRAYGNVSVGSFGTQTVFAGYGGGSGDVKFDVNVGSQNSQGFSAMNPSQNNLVNPDKDGINTQYASGSLEKRISSDFVVGTRFNFSDAKIDTDSGDPSVYGSIADTATDVGRYFKKTQNLGAYVKWVINPSWTSTLNLNHSEFDAKDTKNGQLFENGFGNSWQNGRMNGRQFALDWSNFYEINKTTQAIFGAERVTGEYKASGNSPYNTNRESQGYFVGFTQQIDRLTLQTNLRHDSISTDYVGSGTSVPLTKSAANSWLLGVGYKLNEAWKLNGSMSTGFKVPSAGDLSSNPNLKPEHHQSQEVGVVYSSEKTFFRVAYFDSDTKDAFTYISPAPYVVNTGHVQNQGIELSSRTTFNGYTIKGSFVSQDPVNGVTRAQLARRAKQYGSVDVSREFGDRSLGVRLHGVGERTDPNGRLSGYSLWSVYYSQKMNDELTLRLRMENAFDRFYQLSYGFNTPGRGIYATLQYQPK
jgi:vitamin B12 transporter